MPFSDGSATVRWTELSDGTGILDGIGGTGTLTITGLSGSDTVTASVYSGDLTTSWATLLPVASGTGTVSGGKADVSLTAISSFTDGNYSILVTVGMISIRFKNGVPFSNKSASVNWTELDPIENLGGGGIPAYEGQLGFAEGLPGGTFAVYVTTSTISDFLSASMAVTNFVAVGASANVSEGKVNLITTGALGGTFDKNGTYTVLFAQGTDFRYTNGVQFSNGEAEIAFNAMTIVSPY